MDAFSKVLSSLGQEGVRFIVVGGVAVNAHGFQRFTHDLDLVIDLSTENLGRALGIFRELGFRPRIPVGIDDFLNESLRDSWIRDKGMMVFTLVSDELDGLIVDIFAEEPFQFEDTLAKSFRDDLGGQSPVEISFLDLESLITMKEEAGRPHDQRDVEELKLLRNDHQKGKA